MKLSKKNLRMIVAMGRVCDRLITTYIAREENITELLYMRGLIQKMKDGTDHIDNGAEKAIEKWEKWVPEYIKIKHKPEEPKQKGSYNLHINPDGTVTKKPWTVQEKKDYF